VDFLLRTKTNIVDNQETNNLK